MNKTIAKAIVIAAVLPSLSALAGGTFRDQSIGRTAFNEFQYCRSTLEDVKAKLPEGVFFPARGGSANFYEVGYKTADMKRPGSVRFLFTEKSLLMTGFVMRAPYDRDLHRQWVNDFRSYFGHEGSRSLTREENWTLKDGVASVVATRDVTGTEIVLAFVNSTRCVIYR